MKMDLTANGASAQSTDANLTSLELLKSCVGKIEKLIMLKYKKGQSKSSSDHYLMISEQGNKVKKLQVICFNPAFAFHELLSKKPRSIILTSGTLSPLDTFEEEIGIPFKFKLVNSHVIN